MALVKLKLSDGTFARTHGASFTREYGIWGNMLYRCNTDTCPNYSEYGGRGIKVCERWNSFENFLADMGKAPLGFSIERKDVNGDYTSNNCVWATMEKQANNRRNTRRVTLNGETKSLKEWCQHFNLSWHMVANRYRRNWPIEQLFSAPRKIC